MAYGVLIEEFKQLPLQERLKLIEVFVRIVREDVEGTSFDDEDLIAEIEAWDVLSSEALHNFEASLK